MKYRSPASSREFHRLVEQQDGCIGKEGPCQAEPLGKAGRQLVAGMVADAGHQAFGQTFDIVV